MLSSRLKVDTNRETRTNGDDTVEKGKQHTGGGLGSHPVQAEAGFTTTKVTVTRAGQGDPEGASRKERSSARAGTPPFRVSPAPDKAEGKGEGKT